MRDSIFSPATRSCIAESQPYEVTTTCSWQQQVFIQGMPACVYRWPMEMESKQEFESLMKVKYENCD